MNNQATILGTAATLNIGLGCVPRFVRLTNLNDFIQTEWSFLGAAYGTSKAYYGWSVAAAGDKAAITSAAYGIVPYAGGDLISSAAATHQVRADKDQRGSYNPNAPVASFTVGSVSNKTGNFDVEVHTDSVGPGSEVVLSGAPFDKRLVVLAMTSNGEQANEVTLDGLPDGAVAGKVYAVSLITPRYSFLKAAKGVQMPVGITVGASNVSNTAYPVLIEWEE